MNVLIILGSIVGGFLLYSIIGAAFARMLGYWEVHTGNVLLDMEDWGGQRPGEGAPGYALLWPLLLLVGCVLIIMYVPYWMAGGTSRNGDTRS